MIDDNNMFCEHWKRFGSSKYEFMFDYILNHENRTIEITPYPEVIDSDLLIEFALISLKEERNIEAISWQKDGVSVPTEWKVIMLLGAYRHHVEIAEAYSTWHGKQFTVVVSPAEPL